MIKRSNTNQLNTIINIKYMDTNIRLSVNKRYLLSNKDETTEILPAILGYAREPLVSLEEACQSLWDIVPYLETNTWVVKENSKNPCDGLTQDESALLLILLVLV